MSHVNNITDLGFSSVNTGASMSDKLPTQLQKVADKTRPQVEQCFRALLDNIDDNLFKMANGAGSNQDQSSYFDAMREIRIKRRGLEKRFNQGVEENFRSLMRRAEPEDDAQRTADLTDISFDRLSLLNNDELEENVAFSAMAARASERIATSLMQLNTRINSIFGRQVAEPENCPIGPVKICYAMSDAMTVLDLDITSKLILLKLFEQKMLESLDQIVESANAYLVEMGVLPDFTGVSLPKNGSASEPSRRKPKKASSSDDDAPTEEGVAILKLLQELIHGKEDIAPQPTGSIYDVPENTGDPLSSVHLLNLLSTVQTNSSNKLAQRSPSVDNNAIDALAQLNELVSQIDGPAGSIGQSDRDMIQLVSMLFDVVLDDQNLADAMKVLVGRLQIPMIRIALMDESFFTRKNHPARRLLNEIAMSTIGWTESGDLAEDPLYNKISETVDRVVNEFDDDATLIEALLDDFIGFINVDRRRAERIEKRTHDAERGRARKEHARFLVQEVINQHAVGKQLPDFVVNFLRNAWSTRMFLVLLKEGKESDTWNDVQSTVETLVWSVAPREDGERKELFQRLPALLASLNTGLKEISYNASEMDKFFSNLETAHLQFGCGPETEELVVEEQSDKPKLEREPIGLEAMEVEEISEREAKTLSIDFEITPKAEAQTSRPDSAQETTLDLLPLAELKEEPESAMASSYIKKIEQLEVGNWVNFSREESTPFRCKLVTILQPAGEYIFVNRNGVKVETRVASELATMLHKGELEILDDGQLFDRALESVIVGLRENSKPSPTLSTQ